MQRVDDVDDIIFHGVIGCEEVSKILYFLEQFDQVLGVLPLRIQTEEVLTHLLDLFQKREAARAVKDWPVADACRHELFTQGYLIEDTPQGARLKKRGIHE